MNQRSDAVEATSQSHTLNRAGLRPGRPSCCRAGGALGSYQAGVYHALQEARIEPDWIVGTSIGRSMPACRRKRAADRLARLSEFWSRVQRNHEWTCVA